MDLSIVIVSWKVKDRLKNNLQSIFSSVGNFKFEVFVIDNNSGDGTTEMVSKDFPEVKLIVNSENSGFAKACNQGIARAQGRFILLLNPDMLLNPDTLDKALSWAKNQPSAVVTGIHLKDSSGKTVSQVRRFPRLIDQLAITLKLSRIFPALTNNYLGKNFDYQLAAPVDSIRGSFFLINRSKWKEISGQDRPFLDEKYFIWFEEVDFCRQVYENGGKVYYTPTADCRDDVGQSFSLVGFEKKQRYFRDSMLTYFRKWQPRWQYWLLKSAWFFVLKLISLLKIFKKN